MEVRFRRTGARRYAVVVQIPGKPPQSMDPAPGYDDDIPHDLVHYVVEAALGLTTGVFGRAALGGGTFVRTESGTGNPRDRRRQRRKQQKREATQRHRDEASPREMETSERLAALADVTWRRRHGQRPDPTRRAPMPLSAEDVARVERVADHLDPLAPLWHDLPIGAELVFVWPNVRPAV